MFATLRSIGQAADAAQNPPSVKETAALVAAELRRSARRQTLVRAHLEQQQQQLQQGDAVAPPEKPQGDGCTGAERDGAGADLRPLSDHAVHLPHHIASQLCAAYARPLTALQVADTVSSSLLSLRRDAEAAEVAAAALSDALPTTVLLGMAAHLLQPSCPTLRRLAASTAHEEQAAVTRNARQGQQQQDDSARTRCGSSAVERVLAIVRARAADSATGGNTLKRQRSPTHTGAAPPTVGSAGPTGEARTALALPPPPPLPLPLSASLAAPPPAAVAAPLLRSTAARAQAASSRSRSRSRSPPPPPSLSPPPPLPAPKPAVKAEAETVSVPTVAPSSFSFGVRVAAQRDRGAESGESGVRPAPVTASEAFVPTAPAVLRQTTLAAFTTAPTAAPADAPPSATALPGSGVATNPTALKRSASSSTWYNPPPSLPSTTKAPPYQYDWRGANTAPQPPPQPASAAAASAAMMVGGGQERHDDPHYATSRPGPPPNASAAGFVTASEQLVSDIRQGRTMNSAYLSKRSPALGLRRTGFQPPFRDQQPQGGGNAAAGGHDTSKGPGTPLNRNDSSSSNGGGGGGGRGGKPQNTPRNPAHNEGDDDEGSYPASLLLPDGSVPAILQPLDPKLVTQVAMEILDSGAGAKQVGWEDIAGLQHAKASVEEAIVWPLRRPDLFVGLRDPPRGLLLFGPPGTGKTMIARAIANRAGCTFINISSSSLMSKWMGDGEKLVRCLFAVATVRQPSVIFIDEIDSLLSMRGEGEMDSVRRVKTEFLVQLDGVATDRGDRVLLIGATNRPDELDEAARRRMEKRLYIPLPDDTARKELIQRLLRSLSPATAAGDGEEEGEASPRAGPPAATVVAHTLTDADLNSLVEHTHGYSGADLKQLCREAAMGPLREMSVRQLSEVSATDLRPIQRRDFKQALKRLKPSVGPAEVERYVEWNRLFGSFNEEDSDADDDDEDEEGEGGRRESKKDNSD